MYIGHIVSLENPNQICFEVPVENSVPLSGSLTLPPLPPAREVPGTDAWWCHSNDGRMTKRHQLHSSMISGRYDNTLHKIDMYVYVCMYINRYRDRYRCM